MGLAQINGWILLRINYPAWVLTDLRILLLDRLIQIESLVRCDLGTHSLNLIKGLIMYLAILLVVRAQEDLRSSLGRGKGLGLGIALCVDEFGAEVLDAT